MEKVARMLITFGLLCLMAAAVLDLLTACASNPPPHDDWAKITTALRHEIGKDK